MATVMNPNELVSYLFFNNEHSLYGLLTETNDENVILRADQLLTSFPETHPYVKFEGLTSEDDMQLAIHSRSCQCLERSGTLELC